MASNDVEVLDPAATVEKLKKFASERVLNRRNFIAALGVAGAAAGTELVSGPRAFAQQPLPNGYNQIDVLNLMLNIRYLKATLYSYVTQGADLPPASLVTVGNGGIFNAPAKITFSTQQITDLFNEMYYDDLNQLIALRSLLGVAAANRQTINLLGTGTVTATTTTLTQSQAIALARMLEDLSVTALAGASTYLSGTNLDYAMQAMAVDGFHAGAIRLIAIQTGAQYLSTQTATSATATTATPIAFTGYATAGSNAIWANGPFTQTINGVLAPAAGQILSGIGVPPGAGAVITSVVSAASKAYTGVVVKGTNVINTVSSVVGLAAGQPIVGTYIPANSYIQSVGTNTITIVANVNGVPTASNATTSSTVAPTGILTSGSAIINNVSSVTGVLVGQPITGTAVPSGATVAAVSSSSASPLTITMSGNATATPVVTPTGVVTNGSNLITAVSSVTGLVVGQVITGAGIPAGTTITAAVAPTISLSANATASTPVKATFTGFANQGSATISSASSVANLAVGQLITDSQGLIPGQTTITVIGKATFNAITTSGSNVLTAVSSLAALAVGQVLAGTGIPTGATITALSASASTITMSAAATATITNPESVTAAVANAITISSTATGTSATADTFSSTTGEALSSPTTVTLTIPTTEAITIGQSEVVTAGNLTVTGVNTFGILLSDSYDVEPGDPGSAATSAGGPSALAGTSPTMYQGFFNTAGSGTSSANNPAGFVFARSFQQVLAVLVNYNSTSSATTVQNYEGGFFPVGVSGNINSAI